jgi:hypothetical protein
LSKTVNASLSLNAGATVGEGGPLWGGVFCAAANGENNITIPTIRIAPRAIDVADG